MSLHTEQLLKEQQKGYDRVARLYDRIVGLVTRDLHYRRFLFDRMELQPGAKVLVVACGTGRDFEALLKRIDTAGRITAVDYTPAMLDIARAKLRGLPGGEDRVELIQADAAHLDFQGEFDAAVCTFAMSVIPDYRAAYANLLRAVRPGGSIGIMDVQPTRSGILLRVIHGMLSLFFPHFEEDRETLKWMDRDLRDFGLRKFFAGYIFTAWGSVP